MGWSELEAKAAVEAYFKLLRAEQSGQSTNKASLYRNLSSKFPQRSIKAFELKFQNISAILYEQHQPYCTGLKPKGNYQRLLKLLVLDHLDRSPLPPIEPHEILFAKLRELRDRGPMEVTRKGSGRFGLAIEQALGIQPNSNKAADFMGIELKTKRDKSLQTLFSRTPSRYTQDQDKRGLFERYCYLDSNRNRRALYTSFSSQPDSFGFSLRVEGQVIQVFHNETSVVEYDVERLEEALLLKHSQTAFLAVTSSTHNGTEQCTLDAVTYCKWPSIIRFLRLVGSGAVFLDFTMSEKPGGVIDDHGFLWRLRSDSLDRLYLSTEAIDLAASDPPSTLL